MQMHGRKVHEHNYKIRCDGVPRPVPVGSQSCNYRAANLIEGETIIPNGQRLYWTQEVSVDGHELRVVGYNDKARTKVKETMALGRVNTIAGPRR